MIQILKKKSKWNIYLTSKKLLKETGTPDANRQNIMANMKRDESKQTIIIKANITKRKISEEVDEKSQQ